jgi:hypothetical protein
MKSMVTLSGIFKELADLLAGFPLQQSHLSGKLSDTFSGFSGFKRLEPVPFGTAMLIIATHVGPWARTRATTG